MNDSRSMPNGHALTEPKSATPEWSTDRHDDTGTPSALRQATHTVDRLLRLGGPPPTTLVVHVGEVWIEMTWAVPGPAVDDTADTPPEPVDEDSSATADYITAPAVGTFYLAPSPGAEPFVRTHSLVVAGQQVGIVEAMKLMIPVEAATAGRIGKVLRTDGDPVEYNQPLFELKPW
ncbi:acetyl-CoA carboxylase biotin carboxyl carrier protein [Micromonospora matsumotoense]|uniref:Biotin carboxyl carrier protein of acetyl-CoA carboxylase n=1 Tax=Micromonospora matsumotoense TaxID=121616 RepID=A0A1C5A303_9ACTN|nr:biotin/lipoyl-containing protein [Micromonospora matsumotoense]SCF39424.1 acetyl-CoA carboxylase biotin carboxyl carrier protein [Micromonospora matsumotoense]